MNISSLNWVEKLLLHNTKAYKDFVKNISNHKEIKANSEQEKKFLEVYYNRELKKIIQIIFYSLPELLTKRNKQPRSIIS